jgi:hypothetical protein
MSPLLGEEYVAIFKNGDDLRQDQLILQVPHNSYLLVTQRLIRYRYLFIPQHWRNGYIQFAVGYCSSQVVAVLWIPIGFNADPDPGSQTNEDPGGSESGS